MGRRYALPIRAPIFTVSRVLAGSWWMEAASGGLHLLLSKVDPPVVVDGGGGISGIALVEATQMVNGEANRQVRYEASYEVDGLCLPALLTQTRTRKHTASHRPSTRVHGTPHLRPIFTSLTPVLKHHVLSFRPV